MTFVKKKLTSSCIYLFLFINMAWLEWVWAMVDLLKKNWRQLVCITATVSALSSCMEQQVTPPKIPNDADTTQTIVPIPKSSEIVEDYSEWGDGDSPSDAEAILWALWYNLNDW